MNSRILRDFIDQDLKKKIVLVSGPRQVGKTTLAKELSADNQLYLNFDSHKHREIIQNQSWSPTQKLLVFDEIHKMKNWKRWLKGIYDTKPSQQQILVTGSARMDTFRRTGDSLAGRHFLYRLMPLSVKEIDNPDKEICVHRLMSRGGFPEPYFEQDDSFSNRWRRSHIDRILREDLLDIETVKNIKSLEILTDLLAERVGSAVSYNALARTLEVSPHTVKRWIGLLDSLFVIFVVSPYTRKIAKSILKEPKIYFYDTGRITSGEAARLENLVALHLLKRNYFLEDTLGEKMGLSYLKNKDRHEVDFLTLRNHKPELMVEVKSSDDQLSKSLIFFNNRLSPQRSVQVVLNYQDKETQIRKGLPEIKSVTNFLANLEC
jgi:uncharacterized protein